MVKHFSKETFLSCRKDKYMWLDNLKELKKTKGMSSKQIAEATKLPERTVARIFSGDTPNPYIDTLYRIVVVLGGSLDDVLADSKTVVGNHDLIALHEEVDKLKAEIAAIKDENVTLKDEAVTLRTEIAMLRMKIEHKDEIISLHNYYNKLKPNN